MASIEKHGSITLSAPGDRTMVATVTNAGIEELDLHEGVPRCAMVEASHVLIAVND